MNGLTPEDVAFVKRLRGIIGDNRIELVECVTVVDVDYNSGSISPDLERQFALAVFATGESEWAVVHAVDD